MHPPDPGISRRVFATSSVAVLASLAVPRHGGATPSGRAVPGLRPPANVQVTNDGFTAHIEPVVAVNPRDPAILLAACRVFTGSGIGLASYASADAGRSWQANGLLPGLAPDSGGNPAVAFSRHGTGYLCGIRGTGPVPGQLSQGDAVLWHTSGRGRPLGPPVTVIPGRGGLVDHPGIAVDPSGAAPGWIGATAVVFGSAGQNLVFSASVDAGLTFGPPRPIDRMTGTQANLPVIAAGPARTVHIAYFVVTANAGILTMVSSADHGQTFAAPVSLGSITATEPYLGDVTIKSGPAIAASPQSTAVYAAITSYDRTTGRSQILLFASPDAGRTWSATVTVAASTTLAYLQPQLAVDRAGRIGLSAYAYDLAAQQITVLMFRSPPGRPAFSAPLTVSSQSFNPALAVDFGGTHWLGNYQGLAAGPDGFQPIWTDTRTGSTQVFTATRMPVTRPALRAAFPPGTPLEVGRSTTAVRDI